MHRVLGIDQGFAKVDEIPFDFTRRRMSVIVRDDAGRHFLISKGAVAETLGVCTQVALGDAVDVLAEDKLEDVRAVARAMNDDGFRVLALGLREIEVKPAYSRDDERDLTLMGFVAFLDPPKDSAAEAIQALNANGVAVKILTGDNSIVTRNVCRQVGIKVENILVGPQVEAMSDDGYRALQAALIENPDTGDVIRGTGGLRKMRWRTAGRGKRGGIRVIYYWWVARDRCYLLLAYPKSVQDDLTSEQRKVLTNLMKQEVQDG